jgi:hypothetical protein
LTDTVLKSLARSAVRVTNGLRRSFAPRRIFLYAPENDADLPELTSRLQFYFGPEARFTRLRTTSPSWLLYHGPVLTFCRPELRKSAWMSPRLGVFDINFRTNPTEAWDWFEAEVYLNGSPDKATSLARYQAWKGKLTGLGFDRAYAFGTGPSLASAMEHDWRNGYRIVCNTIVRDAELWHHIDPHAVVAADALYHFGPTEFARTFRRDLLTRLRESPETVFIYPDIFHSLVAREIDIEPHRLIPIEKGTSQFVHSSIASNFTLPGLGNVLNLMLLPIACDLAKNVDLWGFDGRAPDDKLFWANSSRHSYPELMGTLQASHPAFFDHFVPKHDPENYVRLVHGDVLEYCLSQAEQAGWHFKMLHHSWTPTLEKRFSPMAEQVA